MMHDLTREPPGTVISIQSQVAYGHVGNSAAVFPLQLAGVDVLQVPTTLLSNNPHYPTMRGRLLEAPLVEDILLGLEERGAFASARAVLTGYLGGAATADVVCRAVQRAKSANPGLLYCCDPVMGDMDLGFFVEPGLAHVFRDELVPRADVITPNHFEFDFLVGTPVRTMGHLIDEAVRLSERGPGTVVVTGVQVAETPPWTVDVVGVSAGRAWRCRTPRLPIRPAGTGDLFTALLMGSLLNGAALPQALGRAVSGTYAVLEETELSGSGEMRIVQSAGRLSASHRGFDPVEVPRPSARDICNQALS